MMTFNENTPFAELIKYCAGGPSPEYDAAWREFVRRYNASISAAVANRCLNWKSDRLGRQRSDVIDDIVVEVYIILQKKLHTYRVHEGDRAFPFWLATICNREAGNYLKRQIKDREILNPDFYHIDQAAAKSPQQHVSRMEIIEEVVQTLRDSRKNASKNLETQIHVFMLMTIFDLPEDHLMRFHPLVKDLTPDMLKNIKHRSREALRNSKDREL